MAEYIDREAVKEIMKKYRCLDCTNEKSLDCPLCQLHRPFTEISKIPTADVQEVRHGKWKHVKTLPMRGPIYQCTNCKEEYNEQALTMKRCPECGAKMDGKE